MLKKLGVERTSRAVGNRVGGGVCGCPVSLPTNCDFFSFVPPLPVVQRWTMPRDLFFFFFFFFFYNWTLEMYIHLHCSDIYMYVCKKKLKKLYIQTYHPRIYIYIDIIFFFHIDGCYPPFPPSLLDCVFISSRNCLSSRICGFRRRRRLDRDRKGRNCVEENSPSWCPRIGWSGTE